MLGPPVRLGLKTKILTFRNQIIKLAGEVVQKNSLVFRRSTPLG